MQVEAKLKELGHELPTVMTPAGTYVPAVRTGNLVYTSGQGPRMADGSITRGKLGRELTVEQGYAAARQTMLNCLAAVKSEIGDLDRVRRVVKVLGMVNCTEEFGDTPGVINGGSDLLVAVFGDKGRHARTAVGMQSLPFGMCVEIEMIVEVE